VRRCTCCRWSRRGGIGRSHNSLSSKTGIAKKTSVVVCSKLKIDQVDVKGKQVLIRVDFNVPQDKKDPNINTNTARIDASLPTIKHALKNGAKSVVLCSHLGSLMAPVAKAVQEKLGPPVSLMKDVIGPEIEAACVDPALGSVIFLENSRF